MKLENQVCTLEQAKKLKELGIEQNSVWFWSRYYNNDEEGFVEKLLLGIEDLKSDYAAFTVAELGEMLPAMEYTYKETDSREYGNWNWANDDDKESWGMFDYEAQAKAARLIDLLELKTITLEEVNTRLTS